MILTSISKLNGLLDKLDEDNKPSYEISGWKQNVWRMIWTGNNPVYQRCLRAVREGAMSREF